MKEFFEDLFYPNGKLSWVSIGVVVIIVIFSVLGYLAITRTIDRDNRCEALGGEYVLGKGSNVCIKKDALINLN